MANKTINELTQNPSITGAEELATEKSLLNYKNTYSELKTWVNENVVTDYTDAFTIPDGTNNATLTMTNAVDKNVTVTTTSFTNVGDGCELSSLLGAGFPIVVAFDANTELVDPNGVAVDAFNIKGLRRMNDVGGKVQIQLY
jgi:hypothetical protein